MDPTANSEQAILYERIERDGTVWAEITLNRPDKGNALTMAMLTRLGELAAEIAADREVRAVLLRARGEVLLYGRRH